MKHAKKMQNYLRMSKKSSTFAPAFVIESAKRSRKTGDYIAE